MRLELVERPEVRDSSIWLALWTVSTVWAAEDRWLVEPMPDPKCPYESMGGPRR
jgi:hypothetical protein